jgi:hypothetical protein
MDGLNQFTTGCGNYWASAFVRRILKFTVVFRSRSSVARRVCCLPFLASISIGCNNISRPELVEYSTSATPAINKENWPAFVLELEKVAMSSGFDTDSLTVSRVNHDEFFFQISGSEELLSLICSHLTLSPADENLPFVRKFRKRTQKIEESGNFEYFANPNRFEGEKGPQIVLCRSQHNRVLIGHYYFNY